LDALKKAKDEFLKIVTENNLINDSINIFMRPLSPEEVVGLPKRNDYPLLNGKEVMIEANFCSSKGQAFTDEPSDFSGTIKDILNLNLNTNRERALFVSSINAIMKNLNLITATIHCKNSELEECSKELTEFLYSKFGNITISLVGLQPGFASDIIERFGKNNITILDLNPKNIGKKFKGVEIKDSKKFCKDSISKTYLTLATGSTIINNTIDEILKYSNRVFFFGVTIAGVSKLLHLERLCFKAH
jgi:hypothetical protein